MRWPPRSPGWPGGRSDGREPLGRPRAGSRPPHLPVRVRRNAVDLLPPALSARDTSAIVAAFGPIRGLHARGKHARRRQQPRDAPDNMLNQGGGGGGAAHRHIARESLSTKPSVGLEISEDVSLVKVPPRKKLSLELNQIYHALLSLEEDINALGKLVLNASVPEGYSPLLIRCRSRLSVSLKLPAMERLTWQVRADRMIAANIHSSTSCS